MKKDKTFTTMIPRDAAILVGIENDEDLAELEALCESCNILTVGTVTQRIREFDPKFYIGSGKVMEIAEYVKRLDVDLVVFDFELSGSKARNLEMALGVPVLDRSQIILDIFAQRAQSAEGKLQVELAQLKYYLPRLRNDGVNIMSKMKTGVGMRGPGEKKLELDKRKIRDEISALEKKLAKLRDTRDLSNSSAKKNAIPRVCLVGYTNSGKSTLLNSLTKAGVESADKLFATLDPKTSRVYATNPYDVTKEGIQFLLTDTVGFIDKLPHEFINAFESTLDSVRDADLLLHVIDVSNPNYGHQMDVVNEVLMDIGAGEIPLVLVYNKIDRVPNLSIMPGIPSVSVSAKNNLNIDLLKYLIIDILLS